jgi:hypothetical protein
VGAGNLRSGTENGGQASVEGRILFVCLLGAMFRSIHAKTIQKSHFLPSKEKLFLNVSQNMWEAHMPSDID